MQGNFTFIAADPFRIELNAGGKLPERIKLLPWGTSTGRNGNVYVLNSSAAATIAANQKAQGFESVVLDFEHNTVPTSPNYKGEPASIAARGPLEVVEGDGLYLNACAWTADGEKFVGGGHYTDVSPTLAVNAQREVIFVHSAGAVRHGNLPDLTLFRNSADAGTLAKLFTNLTTNSTDTTMPDFKALLCNLLELPADSTDEAIAAAANAELKAEPQGSEPETNAASVKLIALEAKYDALEKKLGGIETNSTNAERVALLAEAARQGKVVPKAGLELNNVNLKALIAELPATVPVEQRTVETNSATTHAVLELNSAADQVRKQLGYTSDEWAKLGK